MGIGKISIIYDESKLSTVCERVDTLEEGERIAKELFKVLGKSGGIGLAANQIGINKRVCVVNVNRPLTSSQCEQVWLTHNVKPSKETTILLDIR